METYLAHHGILGMKWGIRRYQNKDGTLTEAGKKRYTDSADMYRGEAERIRNNAKKLTSRAAIAAPATAALTKAFKLQANIANTKELQNYINANNYAKSYKAGDWVPYSAYEVYRNNEKASMLIADNYASIARGAATAASIISGVGAVAVIGSGVVAAGQLAYSAYLKNQAKKASKNK